MDFPENQLTKVYLGNYIDVLRIFFDTEVKKWAHSCHFHSRGVTTPHQPFNALQECRLTLDADVPVSLVKVFLIQGEDRISRGEGCSGAQWIRVLVSSSQPCHPLSKGSQWQL